MTRHSGPPPIIPRTHISDRARAWRFASLVLAASVVMTMIEATARPDERVASLLTGLFPMIGSPIAWKYGARLTPWWSYQLGRLFLLLGIISASASIYSWRGTPVAGAMGFNLVVAIVFTAAFFRRRDLVHMLILSSVTSLVALTADGIQIEDALSWLLMMLGVTATGVVLHLVTGTAEALAYGDPLTGLENRRAWDLMIGEAVTRHRHGIQPMSVIVIDVDNFKQINDRFGHDGGDEVLRRAAGTWRELVRSEDTLARLGGDEFALLIEGGTHPDALAIAQRLAEALRAATDATCSIGVATLTAGGDPKLVVAAADAQLYVAKHAGRDRVCGIEVSSMTDPGSIRSHSALTERPADAALTPSV